MENFWTDFLIIVFFGFGGAIVVGFVLTMRDLFVDIKLALGSWSDRREMRRLHRRILGRR